MPAAVAGKKKEVVYTILGVLLFSAFMMGMWAVFPTNEGEESGDDAATVLPVDSVTVASVNRKTVPQNNNKTLITPASSMNAENGDKPVVNPAMAAQNRCGRKLAERHVLRRLQR